VSGALLMVRLGLCLYLAIAAAAGPWWLCCCSPARAVDLLASQKPAAPQEETPPACDCCKHAKQPGPTGPDTPALPHLPCECKDTQPTPFLQIGIDADELLHRAADLVRADAATSAAPAVAAPDGLSSLRHVILPGFCCRDVLASLETLRC